MSGEMEKKTVFYLFNIGTKIVFMLRIWPLRANNISVFILHRVLWDFTHMCICFWFTVSRLHCSLLLDHKRSLTWSELNRNMSRSHCVISEVLIYVIMTNESLTFLYTLFWFVYNWSFDLVFVQKIMAVFHPKLQFPVRYIKRRIRV